MKCAKSDRYYRASRAHKMRGSHLLYAQHIYSITMNIYCFTMNTYFIAMDKRSSCFAVVSVNISVTRMALNDPGLKPPQISYG